jgi:8-oxo-dGTP diphosphatase
MTKDRPIPVTAAVIWKDGRVLLAQRPAGDHLALKWEFPGGKIEPGETPEACIERELAEELHIRVRAGRRIFTTLYPYPHHTVRLIFLEVHLLEGTPHPTEHACIAWVAPDTLSAYDLAPADIPMAGRLARGDDLS